MVLFFSYILSRSSIMWKQKKKISSRGKEALCLRTNTNEINEIQLYAF